MAVDRRRLSGGRLREGAYDSACAELEITFTDGSVRRYKGVPNEVWRRLLAAPNPASFHEDRIEEEYAFDTGRSRAAPDARSRLDGLFGPPTRDDD